VNEIVFRHTLESSTLFAGLDEVGLTEVLTLASPREAARDGALFRQEDPPTHLFLVARGRLKLSHLSPSGSQVTLRILGPGELAGCAAVIRRSPYPATATAVDDTTALCWNADRFFTLMRAYPVLAENTLRIMSGRAQDFLGRLVSAAAKTAEERIAEAILRSATHGGPTDRLELRVSRRDLAELSDVNYFTLVRTLSAFRKQGIIDLNENCVVVRLPERLRVIASGSA